MLGINIIPSRSDTDFPTCVIMGRVDTRLLVKKPGTSLLREKAGGLQLQPAFGGHVWIYWADPFSKC